MEGIRNYFKNVGAAIAVMGQSAPSPDLNKKISPGKPETLIDPGLALEGGCCCIGLRQHHSQLSLELCYEN